MPGFTSPPSGGFFGGQVTTPTISPKVIRSPYSNFVNVSAPIPPQPAVPPVDTVSSLAMVPMNVLAPTYSNLKGAITPPPMNPFSSGIGPGTATSVVYGANPSLYHPTTTASQTSMALPAHTSVGGVIAGSGAAMPGGTPATPSLAPSISTGVSNPTVNSAPPSGAALDPTTVAIGLGGAALLLFLL